MHFPLGLAHPLGGKSNEADLVAKEGQQEGTGGSHVEKLLLEGVQFALGLVDLQETQEDALIHEVRD